jgi:hypothetical protein
VTQAEEQPVVALRLPAGALDPARLRGFADPTAESLLLNAGKPGDDISLVYDLHITGAGLPKSRWLEGALIIRAGATQNG